VIDSLASFYQQGQSVADSLTKAGPTFVSEFVKTVPLLVGGLLTLLGGGGVQIVTHRLSRSRDAGTKRQERLERLVTSVYEDTQWIKDKMSRTLFGDGKHDEASPLARAEMLQALYFPELGKEMLAVMEAETPMIKFIGEQRAEQIKDAKAWLAKHDLKPFYEAYKQHLQAVRALVAKCRSQVTQITS